MIKALKYEARDQAAHCTCAVLALLPLILWPNVLTGAFAGFVMGVVREITEEGEISFAALLRALDSRLDLTFWTIGGALAGMLA